MKRENVINGNYDYLAVALSATLCREVAKSALIDALHIGSAQFDVIWGTYFGSLNIVVADIVNKGLRDDFLQKMKRGLVAKVAASLPDGNFDGDLCTTYQIDLDGYRFHFEIVGYMQKNDCPVEVSVDPFVFADTDKIGREARLTITHA